MSSKNHAEAGDLYPIALTPQQRAFTEHRDGPALLLAVPGSGKTTAIVCRVAALIRAGIPKQSILTMTFTRAAATDMKLRFAQLFPEYSPVNHFYTIHGFSWRILKTFSELRDRPMPEILSEDKDRGVSRNGLLARIAREVLKSAATDERLDQLSTAISLAKNRMVEPELLVKKGIVTIPGFCDVMRAFEQEKKDRRLMDYDDMLSAALTILQKDRMVLERFQDQFPYIQVDEAQDNSSIQHEIIDLLAKKSRNLVMIGDEDQSIYVWRGADPAGLLSFRDRYPDAKLLLMEINFRSSNAIVLAANQLIQTNQKREDKQMVAADRVPEQCGISITRVKNAAELQQHVAARLGEDEMPRETAILYRTNRSAYGLCDALERAKIPFRLRDFKDTLFHHPVTRDVKAFAHLIANPNDREAFVQIYAKLGAYLPKGICDFMNKGKLNETVWKTAERYPLLREHQKRRVMELERFFKRLSGRPIQQALQSVFLEVDYSSALEFTTTATGMAPDGMNAVKEILLDIASHEQTPQDFLLRLNKLHHIMLEACRQEYISHIVLSTIHAAKGLEFERVMLVDLLNSDFPGIVLPAGKEPDPADIEILEEERRLFYVAITRAKRYLELLVPAERGGIKSEPSLFVSEYEKALLRHNL